MAEMSAIKGSSSRSMNVSNSWDSSRDFRKRKESNTRRDASESRDTRNKGSPTIAGMLSPAETVSTAGMSPVVETSRTVRKPAREGTPSLAETSAIAGMSQ